MDQSTIKEKIKALLDKPRNPDHIDKASMLRCIDWNNEILHDFARLICEEMMNTNCSCRNCPETKQKAQEILKSLE